MIDRIDHPCIVALYSPHAISGVASAGVRAAAFKPPHLAWRPLIIGESAPHPSAKPTPSHTSRERSERVTISPNTQTHSPASLGLHPSSPSRTQNDFPASPLADSPNLAFALWPPATPPVEQLRIVRDALRSLGATVVVPNDRPHGFAAAALDHHRGLRCAAWIHADHDDGDELIERCGRLADAWRCVSPASMRRAMSLASLNGPGGVLHACVEVPDSPSPLPISTNGEIRLLYAGRLTDAVKRVLDLADLANALSEAGVNYRLTIAGDGPARPRLEAACAASIAAGRVKILGQVNPARISDLFDASDLLVLVSASEGMPMAAMEALARARPLALTRGCGGIVPLAEQTGCAVVVEIGDMPALAAQIATLAREPSHLATMSRAAHRAARQHLHSAALAPKFDAFIHETARCPRRNFTADPSAATERWRAIINAIAMIGPSTDAASQALAADWSREIGLPALSLPTTNTPYTSPAERRFLSAITDLRRAGAKRIALYGAGRHTRGLLEAIRRSPEIVAILDDTAPKQPAHTDFFGLPLLHPANRRDAAIDAVVISSDEYERDMLKAAKQWGIPVLGLYNANPTASSSTSQSASHAA